MASAYVELDYRRREDGVRITLVSGLPLVRPITLGGNPSELRLPGAPPSAAFGSIAWVVDHFTLEPRSAAPPIVCNGQPLSESGTRLADGDAVAIGDYRLTFHEGEPADEPPLINTHLRWKMRATGNTAAEGIPIDEHAAPYVQEFELSVRPLLHAERYAEVQKLAESEITRTVRLDEGDALEGYLKFLWWFYVRMARESEDARAVEIARQAVDLHPEFVPLLVACGTTFLAARDWAAAEEAFARALRNTQRDFIASEHDARVGGVLARHMAGLTPGQRDDPGVDSQLRGALGWDVPEIRVHTPGDELLLWRMARYGRLFGDAEHVRYIYRGPKPDIDDTLEQRQLWEIFDASRQKLWRRIVVLPAIPLVDPSLLVEASALRESLEKGDRALSQTVLDLSHEPEEPRPPVLFDETALAELPKTIGSEVACVRLLEHSGRYSASVVLSPIKDDVVYRQGVICVAVPQDVARKLDGSRLMHARPQGFYLELASGARLGVKYRPFAGRVSAAAPKSSSLSTAWVVALIALAVTVVAGLVRALLAGR